MKKIPTLLFVLFGFLLSVDRAFAHEPTTPEALHGKITE